jgi:hypothetical protein
MSRVENYSSMILGCRTVIPPMSRIRTTTIVKGRVSFPIRFSACETPRVKSTYRQGVLKSPGFGEDPESSVIKSTPIEPLQNHASQSGLSSRNHQNSKLLDGIRPFEGKPKRALFYVPGSSQKMIDKAWTLHVDNIVSTRNWNGELT